MTPHVEAIVDCRSVLKFLIVDLEHALGIGQAPEITMPMLQAVVAADRLIQTSNRGAEAWQRDLRGDVKLPPSSA